MSYAHIDDAGLVALTLSGDRNAYDELVIRHQSAAIAAATHVIGSRHLVEDAVQEAFIAGWMKLDTLSRPEKFGAWICRIARNYALNMRNRFRDSLPDETLEQLSGDHDASPEAALIRSEDNRMLRESIARLPEKIAGVIRLHYFYGLSVADIAARLELSEGGVKWRLYKGREKLREDLLAMCENEIYQQRIHKAIEQKDEIYTSLRTLAEEHRSEMGKDVCIVCMLSSKKNFYYIIQDLSHATDEEAVKKALQTLIQNNDTVIESLLCMFLPDQLDLPSWAFRKVLTDINAENMNTEIYGQGLDRIISKKLSLTMPPDFSRNAGAVQNGYTPIRTPDDVERFLDQCGDLHDGQILSVSYTAGEMILRDTELRGPIGGELTLLVLAEGAPSMPVVELAFHAVSDWSITSTDLFFSIIDCSYESSGNILWTESLETDRKSLKGTNFVIARGVDWRFVDDPPSLNRV